MVPMRLPIKVPKIKKYKPVVMTGGKMVCIQIRMKRRTSLRTIVQ